MPSARRLPSRVRRSRPAAPGGSLVVRNTCSRGTPLSRTARPTSRSLRYMLGVILVVSGPTVVGPLLNFVRPTERVQRVLIWDGSLIDPVGAILGAVTFYVVVASTPGRVGSRAGHFLASMGSAWSAA